MLDTYFRLNIILEADAIQFATLHLEGDAHDWWYHGLVTFGQANITSYVDVTQRLIDRFDQKNPDILFRELEQLKQSRSHEDFIVKFEQITVMVTDISEE